MPSVRMLSMCLLTGRPREPAPRSTKVLLNSTYTNYTVAELYKQNPAPF